MAIAMVALLLMAGELILSQLFKEQRQRGQEWFSRTVTRQSTPILQQRPLSFLNRNR